MGVVPVIYYSVLLGLGLPGEWQAGLWELGGGWRWGSFFDGCPSSVLTPRPRISDSRIPFDFIG